MSGASALPLALTMGEPAGVGGELALKVWRAHERMDIPIFFAIDDPMRLEVLAHRLDADVPIRAIDRPEEASAVFQDALPVLVQPLATGVTPGEPDVANAEAVMQSIERAVELTVNHRAGAVVTNPVHKATLYEAGFRHPGQTEFLGKLAGRGAQPVMMLACPGLRVVPISTHLSLRKAINAVKTERIVSAGAILHRALITDFGIPRPRIAVAALNPHAGESGTLGKQEVEVIAPAVAELAAAGIRADGPHPADTLFHPSARKQFDAILCMYHDQALIPLKTVDFQNGVNITLGLPFVRTSPDHGTGFEIAGTGRASATSLVAALTMAATIVAHRARARDREKVA
ncbi:MAG: 4-hydroxythreonine-4-phosphate dehydrogenase PdxA [Alphaproteobacteria bacterium]|nr:4-hydroxythreonine-4-phosphate dehydrogenase PdxA [Alphaproteobacteria bacterium]